MLPLLQGIDLVRLLEFTDLSILCLWVQMTGTIGDPKVGKAKEISSKQIVLTGMQAAPIVVTCYSEPVRSTVPTSCELHVAVLQSQFPQNWLEFGETEHLVEHLP